MPDQATLPDVVEDWFRAQGFARMRFDVPVERITTHSMGQLVFFKLRERADHVTYYKEATGGSLIVFEVSTSDGKVRYTGYCPLLLFGFWERKVSFKPDAGMLAPYRKEGFEVAQRFKRMLEGRGA